MRMKIEANGLGIILFIVFLILKLTHAIDWSWIWVTSPIWLPITAILILWWLSVTWILIRMILRKI